MGVWKGAQWDFQVWKVASLTRPFWGEHDNRGRVRRVERVANSFLSMIWGFLGLIEESWGCGRGALLEVPSMYNFNARRMWRPCPVRHLPLATKAKKGEIPLSHWQHISGLFVGWAWRGMCSFFCSAQADQVFFLYSGNLILRSFDVAFFFRLGGVKGNMTNYPFITMFSSLNDGMGLRWWTGRINWIGKERGLYVHEAWKSHATTFQRTWWFSS